MEIPRPTGLLADHWVRVAPCERVALEALRDALRQREETGGRGAVTGLGLFSLRGPSAVEAYLSPEAATHLAVHLDGLAAAPSLPPPDAPSLKLEEGDRGLWAAVVQRPRA